MTRSKLLSAVSAIALMGSVAAHADVTITINGVVGALPANNGLTSQFASQAGYIEQRFNGTAINSLPVNYTLNGRVVQNDLANTYLAPENTPGSNTSRYLTVPTDLSVAPTSVHITLPFQSNYFGLFWGSVDTYNTIAFSSNGSVFKTVVGQTILDAINAQQAANDKIASGQDRAFYVNFAFMNGKTYDKIILTSSNFAFESDNHVFGVVPVPGSALLLLSGVLGAGFIARRRKPAAA